MDDEMGLTPEELARLTPEELAELRQVYAEGHAEGHAAGYAVGYTESYVKGVRDALTDRGPAAEREAAPDNGEEYRDG
jgi:flagellar biosynthesis/type III secretory pathway protein FliH